MPPYQSDRIFTNYIHQHLAIPQIYEPLGWSPVSLPKKTALSLDLHMGIDYIFKDKNGEVKTVQERFRDMRYQNFSDFTIRYRRDSNPYHSRHQSEYYKLKAHYFAYGITNCNKSNEYKKCTDFVKFALINLQSVYEMIDEGHIIIINNHRNRCTLENRKIICPIKYNSDKSSSFFPIEISFLAQLWGNKMIISQKGFFR